MDEISTATLAEYVAGHLAPAQGAQVEAWLADSPENRAELEQVREIWGETGGVPRAVAAVDLDIAWKQINKPVSIQQNKNLHLWRYISIAAVIAVGFFAFNKTTISTPETKTYITIAAQRATITLIDGSKVILAPSSKLRLTSDFNSSRRDVYLEGEAYFDVTSRTEKPFTVFTANASTQVLGTSFTVRKYPADKAVRVVVATGKVAFSGAGILQKGDAATLTNTGIASVEHGTDVSTSMGWTNGRLIFKNMPVSEVIERLNSWYGVRFEVVDQTLLQRRATVTFDNATRSEVISILSRLLNATPQVEGDVITLYSN